MWKSSRPGEGWARCMGGRGSTRALINPWDLRIGGWRGQGKRVKHGHSCPCGRANVARFDQGRRGNRLPRPKKNIQSEPGNFF